MLEELLLLTSKEPYSLNGGMRVNEISIKPWETPNSKFRFEIWTDDRTDDPHELWEVTCADLRDTRGIPLAVVSCTQLKLYADHPLRWNREVYFTITSSPENIPALMGELFIEHTKICGNWIDFQWLYSSLSETLETLRKNELAIPVNLQNAFFHILDRHGVTYQVNSIDDEEQDFLRDCQVLFFSHENWPDSENFRQSYIIGKGFSAQRVG